MGEELGERACASSGAGEEIGLEGRNITWCLFPGETGAGCKGWVYLLIMGNFFEREGEGKVISNPPRTLSLKETIMRRDIFPLGRGLLLSVILFGLIFSVFKNATAADYYKGQVITFLVPTSAGGGADIWARLISNNLGQFIPGNPTIVVRNMPTSAGVVAGNLAWHAKPDGKTLLFCLNKIFISNMLRTQGAEYYLEKMHPVYAAPFGVTFYFKPGLVPEPKDIVKTKGLIWAQSPPTGGTSIVWVFAKAVLGFESKDVMGYGGSGPSRLAFITGEANCTGDGSDGYVTSWKGDIERGTAVALFQSGKLDADGNVVKESHLPPIPTVKEIYEQIYGKAPSGPSWVVYKLLLGCRAYDNSTLMPPTTKPEYVRIIRKAFEDMAKDPKFLKEADRLAKGAIHIVGEPLTRGYAARISGSPETIEFMKKYLSEKYDVRFQ
ncbi:MAG: hypothetical protein QME90_14415 [Thermodesulfobacteriota bacterium]|nr:hypothetical protein [Thermodesulfobacteriota bacterium]